MTDFFHLCISTTTKGEDFSWQLKCIQNYDQLRKEFHHLQNRLQESEELNNQRLLEIETLEKEVKKIPKLTAKISKREKKIRQLESKCETKEQATQTDKVEMRESATQFETETVHNEASTHTERVQSEATMEIHVSDEYVQNIHSYAQIGATASNVQFKYSCFEHGLHTNKKSTYITHKMENCTEKPERKMKCPVCKGLFTYHTLRLHLNHYATGIYRPKGLHARYSSYHHARLLDQHKKLKSKK